MAKWSIKFEPNIVMNEELVSIITKIRTYVEVIKDIPIGQGQKENLLSDSFRPNSDGGTLRDDIVMLDIRGTAAIEGNVLNDEEINHIIKNENAKSVQEKEILNMKKIRQHIESIELINEKVEITEDLIKSLNKIVMDGIKKDDIVSGSYRKYEVKVGRNFQPTRFEDVPSRMKEFIRFINSEEILSYDPLLRAIIAHFYLVTIHPFGDGNGRTSRALEAYLFYNAGMSVHGFYSLNNYYYKHYDEYFKILDDSRFKYQGCLQEFVLFALKGYQSELQVILEKVKDFVIKISYVSYVEEFLKCGEITARQRALLQWIKYNNALYTKTQIVNSEDTIISIIFDGIKTTKTKMKDLNNLLKYKLIDVNENEKIIINYNVMKKFTT